MEAGAGHSDSLIEDLKKLQQKFRRPNAVVRVLGRQEDTKFDVEYLLHTARALWLVGMHPFWKVSTAAAIAENVTPWRWCHSSIAGLLHDAELVDIGHQGRRWRLIY